MDNAQLLPTLSQVVETPRTKPPMKKTSCLGFPAVSGVITMAVKLRKLPPQEGNKTPF
jgi:hypothetical protein